MKQSEEQIRTHKAQTLISVVHNSSQGHLFPTASICMLGQSARLSSSASDQAGNENIIALA